MSGGGMYPNLPGQAPPYHVSHPSFSPSSALIVWFGFSAGRSRNGCTSADAIPITAILWARTRLGALCQSRAISRNDFSCPQFQSSSGLSSFAPSDERSRYIETGEIYRHLRCCHPGTNERALIELITQRSNLQRQHIKMQYKTMFGQVCRRRTLDTLHFFPGFSQTTQWWTKWTFQRDYDFSIRCPSWLRCLVIASSSACLSFADAEVTRRHSGCSRRAKKELCEKSYWPERIAKFVPSPTPIDEVNGFLRHNWWIDLFSFSLQQRSGERNQQSCPRNGFQTYADHGDSGRAMGKHHYH